LGRSGKQIGAAMTFDLDVSLEQLLVRRQCTDEELDDRIGRTILGGLRHPNPLANLRHDCFGLFQIEDFNRFVVGRFKQAELCRFHERFEQVFEQLLAKEKIEVRGDKVRALYGHSLRRVIVGEMKWPKTELFHATRKRHLESILEHGLRPQGRTWVHLTSNERYADTILKNHDYEGRSVLLRVVPDLLEDFDITFRKPNSHVWLVNRIPPVGIKFCEPNSHSEVG
jgi:putative RNA 2'-phosphotransferase